MANLRDGNTLRWQIVKSHGKRERERERESDSVCSVLNEHPGGASIAIQWYVG